MYQLNLWSGHGAERLHMVSPGKLKIIDITPVKLANDKGNLKGQVITFEEDM